MTIKPSLLAVAVMLQLAPLCASIGDWSFKEIAPRLVAVSGANRGVGLGIVRQVPALAVTLENMSSTKNMLMCRDGTRRC